jgi:eukaryotic-like serine/threonine-protein kinase
MFSPQAEEALAVLMQVLTQQPELEEHVHERWRTRGSSAAAHGSPLSADVIAATDALGKSLRELAQPDQDVSSLAKPFAAPSAPVLLLWCYASTWRRDVQLAPILTLAAKQAELRERVAAVASGRVLEGPLADALACAPDR